jgi:hypothetical protein
LAIFTRHPKTATTPPVGGGTHSPSTLRRRPPSRTVAAHGKLGMGRPKTASLSIRWDG